MFIYKSAKSFLRLWLWIFLSIAKWLRLSLRTQYRLSQNLIFMSRVFMVVCGWFILRTITSFENTTDIGVTFGLFAYVAIGTIGAAQTFRDATIKAEEADRLLYMLQTDFQHQEELAHLHQAYTVRVAMMPLLALTFFLFLRPLYIPILFIPAVFETVAHALNIAWQCELKPAKTEPLSNEPSA